MKFDKKGYSPAELPSEKIRPGKDGTPSDLTLARARQSVKTEGRNNEYDGNSAGEEISERILLTKNGEKTIYEAAVPCNRCGACAETCPSYKAIIKENLSPRGICQLTRLLKEYRLKNPSEALKEAVSSCLLCGACENLCHASIPVPEIVLELRRHYLKHNPGIMQKMALRLKLNHRRLYSFWLKTAFLMLKLRLKWFAKILGTAQLTGRTQEEFEELNLKPSLSFAENRLKEYEVPPKHAVKWAYFSSCETNYIMPEAAQATVELLARHIGEGMLAGNLCCGFMSHRNGNLEEARKFAEKNIEIFETLREKHGNKFIIVTDCSACAAFLKKYEQLFIEEKKEEDFLSENYETVHLVSGGDESPDDYYPNNVPDDSQKKDATENDNAKTPVLSWRDRAKAFSEAVRDISEILNPGDFPKIGACAEAEGKTVCYQPSCHAIYHQNINEQPEELIRHLCGKCLAEFDDSTSCCGGHRGNEAIPKYILMHTAKNKILNLANAHAEIIVSTDPCCINAVNAKAKKWYPGAHACHFSVYINSLEKKYKRFS